MEEEKAAAYYDELTRKGSGAARFKQGLGFSEKDYDDDAVPKKGSSGLSFVKASSPTKFSQLEKQAQLSSIQNKLKKNPEERGHRDSERRSRERDYRERYSKRRSRSRSRSRERHRDRDRDRDRERRWKRSRSRSRSVSPRERRRSEKNGGERDKAGKERILGFDKMTPAERVKAKMKLQLAETAEKDASIGMGSGWERFEFDKDAPLDDEEVEAAEDDAALVKHIGQSFRFSAIEARREDKIKAAHDEAMFGAPTFQPSVTIDSEPEVDNNKKESNESGLATSLLSEKVLAKQQGSWRDRARKG